MKEKDLTFEGFKTLLYKEKSFVITKLGRPDILYTSIAVYKRNDLWLVALFRDNRRGDRLVSELWAMIFFDKDLNLLWSYGVRLIPQTTALKLSEYNSVGELTRDCGLPHAEAGSGKSAIQYITDNGHIVFVLYRGDKIIEITQPSLMELEISCRSN